MHRNVLKHTGVRADYGTALILRIQSRKSVQNIHSVFMDKRIQEFFKHQEEHVRSAASSLTADCFLETEMTTLFGVFNKTIWCFKLH